MDIDRVLIVIPAYNVGQHLGELLDQIGNYISIDKVIVIDDGSDDDTADIGAKYSAKVISFEENHGKGIALRIGFNYSVAVDAEWIMTIDGDLQHDPSHIPDFFEMADNAEYDLLIGMRDRSPGIMPWDRRFSNWSTSSLLSMITDQDIKDAQCGYRLFRAELLRGMKLHRKRYDLETEFLLKAAGKGARIGWVTISTKYQGESSSIRRFVDTLRFIRTVVIHLVYRLFGRTGA